MSRRSGAVYSHLSNPALRGMLLLAGLAAAIALCLLLAAPAGTVGAAATAQQDSTDPELLALIALYATTDGGNWTNNTNWLSSEPIGKWHGVTTDASGRVTELRLNHNKLS